MAILPCGSSTWMAPVGQPQLVLKFTPAGKLSTSCHCVPDKVKTLGTVSSMVFSQHSSSVLFNMVSSRNQQLCRGSRLVVRANSDYYAVLGVQNSASKSDIKIAYRRLARSYHPDVNKKPDAEQTFKDISNAYEILSDDKKRSIYDKSLKANLNGSRWGMEDFSNPFEFMESVFNGMDDMDEWDRGGGGGSWSRGSKGEDLLYDLVLNFKEAVFGVEKDIEVTQLESCSTCNGSGSKPGTRQSKCITCRGHGEVITSASTPFGIFEQVMTCPGCSGSGKTFSPCTTCRGEGRVRKSNRISLNIPAGVDSGSRLRVRGEGNVGTRGGSPGDLFAVIEVRSDPVLKRVGNNILYTCKVSYSDAILGTKTKVPTVDGLVELKIPGGTQPGTTLVMGKKGVPFLGRKTKRGDQLVVVQVEIPRQVSGEEKKLVEEIARLGKAAVGR